MPEYAVREFGDAGFKYVAERLADGKTLARRVASVVLARQGRTYTYVPANALEAALFRFDTGGIAETCRTLPWYARVVSGYLGEAANRLCVLENNPAEPGDPWLSDACGGQLAAFQDEVYHVLLPEDLGSVSISGVIREATSAWISLGFMTTCPPGWDPDSLRFSATQIEHLSQHVRMVAVDAYDLEGWILWEAGGVAGM